MIAIEISEWIQKLGSFIPLLLFLILPIVFRKLKKNTTPNINEFYQHLQSIGINSSISAANNDNCKIGAWQEVFIPEIRRIYRNKKQEH